MKFNKWTLGLAAVGAVSLAAAAKANGLTTGAYWDLTPDRLAALNTAVTQKNWGAKVAIGWDPFHVEATGLTQIGRAHV